MKVLLRLTKYLILVLWIGFTLFPIVWMFLTSFKTPLDVFANPPVLISIPPCTKNWIKLFSPGTKWEGPRILHRYLPNSVIASTSSVAITIPTSILAAYAISRFRFKGRRIVAIMILATRMLPPVATTIPLYIFFAGLGMLDTLIALILVYSALSVPLATWMLIAYLDEVPREIEEAAQIDGASLKDTLFRVVIPIIAPGIAATSIFTFLLAWNDFAIAFFLTKEVAKTLPVHAPVFVTEVAIEWGAMSAFGTFYIIPALFFSVFFSRYLIKGLTLGAVKV